MNLFLKVRHLIRSFISSLKTLARIDKEQKAGMMEGKPIDAPP
jgi:hypothetical protein